MRSDPKTLLQRHDGLTHSELKTVTSHVQREDGEWVLNTLMVEGSDVPFRYRRKKRYRDLKGARVNLTYYPETVQVGGLEFETMKVVRIARA